ncbi:hypothetical protein M9Y10_025423 [Tritrichomonas musculus]|uniref:Uncharacterized protein n=1 Tax=Tritrichomonas musculus TaxID=1915356 RepID=A0ABR2H8M6_9EUKA
MKNSNNKIPAFAYFSWGVAFLSIFILMIDLFIRAPEPLNPFIKEINKENFLEKENNKQSTELQTHYDDELVINENCCIATIFEKSSIQQTILLGYSLLKANSNDENSKNHKYTIPKTFALFILENDDISISENELLALKKYFEIINITSEQLKLTNNMKELLFWTTPELKKCYPLVGLAHNGLFNKAPNRICNSIPFSAVSKTGDVVFFDTSLMVLDPTKHPGQMNEKYNKNNKNKQFKKYINYQITNWKPLPTDLSVEDYNNEFLDFWMKFGTPTFIHYEDSTFYNAINNVNKTSGSQEIFKIITKLANEVKLAHPNIYHN